LPWAVKALITIGGIRGNKEKGQQIIARVANEGNLVRNEARVLLALLYRRERRPLDAAKLIEGLIEEFPRNYVLHLELAGMYSDADNKPRALQIFRNARGMVLNDEHRFGRMPTRLRDALDRRIDALEQEQSAGSESVVAD
jgi:Tfp pilus assembly protein PilF